MRITSFGPGGPTILPSTGSRFIYNESFAVATGTVPSKVFEYLIIDPVNGEKCICHFGAQVRSSSVRIKPRNLLRKNDFVPILMKFGVGVKNGDQS